MWATVCIQLIFKEALKPSVDREEKNSLTLLNSFFWRNKSFNGKSWYSAKAVCLNSDVSRVEYMPRPVCWLITVSPCLTLGLRSWKSQRRAKQCRAVRFSPQELIKIHQRLAVEDPANYRPSNVRRVILWSLKLFSVKAKQSNPGQRWKVTGSISRVFIQNLQTYGRIAPWHKKRPPPSEWLYIYDHLSSPFDLMQHGPLQLKELS